MTVYLPDGVGAHQRELERVGPHTTGVGCLYLKDLEANDLTALTRIISRTLDLAGSAGPVDEVITRPRGGAGPVDEVLTRLRRRARTGPKRRTQPGGIRLVS